MTGKQSALESHVLALVAWLGTWCEVPHHESCRVLDTTKASLRWDPASRKVWTIKLSSLQTVDDFAPQFDELLSAGYGWINLRVIAIHNGILILGLEIQRSHELADSAYLR